MSTSSQPRYRFSTTSTVPWFTVVQKLNRGQYKHNKGELGFVRRSRAVNLRNLVLVKAYDGSLHFSSASMHALYSMYSQGEFTLPCTTWSDWMKMPLNTYHTIPVPVGLINHLCAAIGPEHNDCVVIPSVQPASSIQPSNVIATTESALIKSSESDMDISESEEVDIEGDGEAAVKPPSSVPVPIAHAPIIGRPAVPPMEMSHVVSENGLYYQVTLEYGGKFLSLVIPV